MIEQNVLANFTGTEHYYKHMTGLMFTDGVKYVADEAKAYWLIDEILFSVMGNKKVRRDFVVWRLEVKDKSAILIAEDGDYNKLYSKNIGYTDFPLEKIEMWYENGVLILPSEH